MKNTILIFILTCIGVLSCKTENPIEGNLPNLNNQWSLINYANINGEVRCEFEPGQIIWDFRGDILHIKGRLVTPWAFVPCYEVDSAYTNEVEYTIKQENNEKIITITDLGLVAKISEEDNLIIEIISSTTFRPQTAGVKVFFERI